jgi:hypothetical protein
MKLLLTPCDFELSTPEGDLGIIVADAYKPKDTWWKDERPKPDWVRIAGDWKPVRRIGGSKKNHIHAYCKPPSITVREAN